MLARLKRGVWVTTSDSSPSHAALVGGDDGDRRRSSQRRDSASNIRSGIGSALYAASAAAHDRIKKTQNVSRSPFVPPSSASPLQVPPYNKQSTLLCSTASCYFELPCS
uniref:Uncharacterized protein n=1 Tax=Plectus sambesii TaxID=2011161 RepID=A0A914USS0_9BILA